MVRELHNIVTFKQAHKASKGVSILCDSQKFGHKRLIHRETGPNQQQ